MSDLLTNPRQVAADLGPLGDLIWRALADGCDRAAQYHESRGFARVDPWVHAALTRQSTLRYLDDHGVTNLGYRLKSEKNAGIHLSGERYEIRVLKTEHLPAAQVDRRSSGVPFPQSVSRERYFRQPLLGDGYASGVLAGMEPATRLVSLWDTDAEFQLLSLDLVCTKGPSADRSEVECYWRVPLVGGSSSVAMQGESPETVVPSQLADLHFPRRPTGHRSADAP